VIHQRYADAIESGRWNRCEEMEWYRKTWWRMIPSGCGCKESWIKITDAIPIDFTSAETAFQSLWLLHNEVSANHAKKPEISYELCRALYCKQPNMDDCCYAVTSLSPNRTEHQTLCLNTWKRAGLTIFAVQSVSEVQALKPLYPQVATWCIESMSGPPTINRLADIATTTGRTVLVINSDIEIHGEQRLIREAVAAGTLIGIRHNYDSQWWINNREGWGVDVFGVSPFHAAKLPRLPLQIGRPVWDYALLDYFNDKPQKWIGEPLFFHRNHKCNWNGSDWDENAAIVEKAIGLKLSRSDVSFRRQFPLAG